VSHLHALLAVVVRSLPFVLVFCAAASMARAQSPPAGTVAEPRDLANQVNNPAAPLTLVQLRNLVLPDAAGAGGPSNLFQIQPVLPMGPFKTLPIVQLVKITLPFVSLPSPVGMGGVGDLEVFDLVTVAQSWGRWGYGPSLVFPTASVTALGEGKWQAGPAFALMFTGIRNLTAGAVVQNPMSFAGESDRPGVNNMIVTPTVTYSLEKGWFAGLSDYDWTFDWKNGGAPTVLLGAQVGRVVNIGTQALSVSIEVGGAAVKPSGSPSPGWLVGIEFVPIFKGHIQ
jgi:hypothetical protein